MKRLNNRKKFFKTVIKRNAVMAVITLFLFHAVPMVYAQENYGWAKTGNTAPDEGQADSWHAAADNGQTKAESIVSNNGPADAGIVTQKDGKTNAWNADTNSDWTNAGSRAQKDGWAKAESRIQNNSRTEAESAAQNNGQAKAESAVQDHNQIKAGNAPENNVQTNTGNIPIDKADSLEHKDGVAQDSTVDNQEGAQGADTEQNQADGNVPKDQQYDETENQEYDETENQEYDETENQEYDETENQEYDETDNDIFTDSQGIMYTLDGDTCYVSGCTQDVVRSVVIPQQIEAYGSTYTVKGIQKQAFSNCNRLRKIELPNSVSDLVKGTFSKCRNLTSISIVPVKYSVKRNGKTSAVGIRLNSVLLGEADRVRLEIRKDLIKQAAAKKGTDQIVVSVRAAGSDGERYAVPEQIKFEAEAAEALSKCGKALKMKLIDTDGEKYYVMMDQSRLKQAGGVLSLKLQRSKAGSTAGNLKSDLQKALKKSGIAQNKASVYKIAFGNRSKAGAELVLPVKNTNAMEAGSAVYVYRYSERRRDFVTVLYHPAVVSGQGNLRLSLDKGGVYILSAKPLQYMCRKLSDTFITESGSTYYIDGAGQIVCGWKKLGESYYYFDRKNGKMAADCMVDGIQLKKDGRAAATAADVQKIQTMIKARSIVLQITRPEDTLEQKIKKCFLWIFQFPYRQYRRLNPIYRQAGWEVTFANDIFDRHQGCCVSEASATAFLFHECGCETVYVATDTGHAWVELNGRVYDPLFAEARGFDRYYNRPYEGYGMYAVVKHKI